MTEKERHFSEATEDPTSPSLTSLSLLESGLPRLPPLTLPVGSRGQSASFSDAWRVCVWCGRGTCFILCASTHTYAVRSEQYPVCATCAQVAWDVPMMPQHILLSHARHTYDAVT